MLSVAELDSMAGTVEQTFDKTATVQRASIVDDGMGGSTGTFSPVPGLVDVPCRLDPSALSPVEQAAAGRLGSEMGWVLTFRKGTDVRAADRVIVDGRAFEVVAQRGPRSLEVSRRVVATEIK